MKNALNATVLEDSVPPTSIQTFLDVKHDLPAVVISDHGEYFENRYYNGILDDAENLSFNRYYSNSTSFMYLLYEIFFSEATMDFQLL